MSEKPVESKTKKRQTPRSRFQPKVTTGMRIEERDEQILCDLFLHRLMSRGQIERTYFSSTVRANARLRLLFDYGFVGRHYPPYAPFGAQAIYSVGKAALPIVARRLEMDLPEVTRLYRRTKTPTFIEHTLAITDFRLTLSQALKVHPEIALEWWLCEMQCRHEWDIRAQGGTWKKEVFKPDAFFRLRRRNHDKVFDFFVEIDLGHTSARQFEGKLHTHARYLDSGLFEQTYGNTVFCTLVVTTGARRLQNLSAIVMGQGVNFVRTTTFGALYDPRFWTTLIDV